MLPFLKGDTMKNIPKQDRVAPRTPEDLKRAYNFSALKSSGQNQAYRLGQIEQQMREGTINAKSGTVGDWTLGVCEAFKAEYSGKSLYHTSTADDVTVTVALTPLGVYVETKTTDKTEVKSKTWLDIVK